MLPTSIESCPIAVGSKAMTRRNMVNPSALEIVCYCILQQLNQEEARNLQAVGEAHIQ